MREEQRRLLPDLRQELVEIVGGWRSFASRDTLRLRDIVQQAIVGVVQKLVFLPLLYAFDNDAKLFAMACLPMTAPAGL